MKVDVKLNRAGVKELLKSQELQGGLAEMAGDIAKRCGNGYASDTHMTPGRVIASVYTETHWAMKDNEENNTILKNLK